MPMSNLSLLNTWPSGEKTTLELSYFRGKVYNMELRERELKVKIDDLVSDSM